MNQGLILLAHGARDARWADPFEELASQVRRERPGVAVQLAYLDFMAPDMLRAGAQLVALGCQRVEVLPLFLGSGGHVRKDVPELMAQLLGLHRSVQWTLHPAVGSAAVLIQAMTTCALAALDDHAKP